MLSRKKSLVFDPNVRSPSASPGPRAHWPCDHGPRTMRLDVDGLCFAIASWTRRAPWRLFASYHPLTVRTAGVTFSRCGATLRALPEGVLGAVCHHVVPERRAALEIQLVGVRQRAHREKERVAVVGAIVE